MNAKKILLKAARILEKSGWIRYEMERNGRYCMIGALRKAAFGSPYMPIQQNQPHRSYHRAVRELADYGYCFGWNDEPDRRGKEVIAALRKTARKIKR